MTFDQSMCVCVYVFLLICVCVNIIYIILSFFSDSLAISVCDISVDFKSVLFFIH